MIIPEPRGPLSAGVIDILVEKPGRDPAGLSALYTLVAEQLLDSEDVIDDDVQLTLFCLYELHYGGLDGVDDGWEWHPGLIAIRIRHVLEQPFEAWLRAEAGPMTASVRRPDSSTPGSDATAALLSDLAGRDGGPVCPATWPKRRRRSSLVNS